jgi:uncharacterized protein YndB with AHSA1/START domain
LIFEALTRPDLIPRWWGFGASEWLVCEVDLQIGGRFRNVIRDGDQEIGFHGVFREIARPHRLVFTEMFEGLPGPLPDPDDYPVNIMTLDEADGVTTLSVLVQHKTREERDMVLASGMESGMQVSYDRMEDLVRSPS